MTFEVRLMGNVSATRDGIYIPTGGPKQQLVLAVLALSAGVPVSTERLIDLVWDDRPPRTARRTVQSYIASLRTAFGHDAALSAVPGGYVLDVPRDQVDLLAFEDDVSAALARTDAVPDTTAQVLGEALQRWTSPLEFPRPTLAIGALVVPFAELRLQAIEALVAAQIDCGKSGEAVRRLEALVRESPTRENLWLQLARGLTDLGRRDAALQAIQRAREHLREQLGIDPSNELRRFEGELLTQEATGRTDTGNGLDHDGLPSGRVTFVFTDIEGSTRLLRTLPDAYQKLLDDHRRILRAAWSANEGHEIGTEGDSFFVAFSDPSSATRACIAAQEGLCTHEWPENLDVRVRMGIHSGLAYPRNGDYAALAVHQASRIAGSAHGEQVLISSDSAEMVPQPLAGRLHDLGRFRVRDFEEPVRLFGVDTGTSASYSRAPRLVPADGHNLITSPGTFLARVSEFAHVIDLLAAGEVVTVTGPGGVGKTRLATEVGLHVVPSFSDGVWMARLDSIDDEDLIAAAIAEAVGTMTGGSSDPWSEVLDHLSRKRALLIVDNCEHVLAGCVARVAELLTNCPDVTVLATSRAPLGLLGERVVRLAPLASVRSGSRPSDAVQLFLDRAARIPDITSDQAHREIVELCVELDGLPLAIELAAAHLDVLTPRDMVEALALRSATLATGDPRVPERQRSLANLLDWSYELLTAAEQAALRRLTVFPASFDLVTASTAIANDDVTPSQVPDLVWSLAGKSLVTTEPAAGTTRYRLLRTVRSYAEMHLSDSERIGASRRLVERFTATVGPDLVLDRGWVGDVAMELNNLRSLVLATGVDEPLRQKLAWSIGRYHDLTDEFAAGIDELERHLEVLPGETPERVALLTLSADLRLRVGDLAGAQTTIDHAASLCERVGSAGWDDAGVLRTKGDLAMRAGRYEEATRIVGEALTGSLTQRGEARLLDLLGLTLAATDDFEGSARAFEQELRLWISLGDDSFAATTLGNLAETALRSGLLADAARHQLACFDVARVLGQPVLVAFSIMMAAQFSARLGRWRDAVRLQLAADAVLADVGYVLFETDAAARRELLEAADEFVEVETNPITAGSAHEMALDEAIELAASTLESVKQKEEPWS